MVKFDKLEDFFSSIRTGGKKKELLTGVKFLGEGKQRSLIYSTKVEGTDSLMPFLGRDEQVKRMIEHAVNAFKEPQQSRYEIAFFQASPGVGE